MTVLVRRLVSIILTFLLTATIGLLALSNDAFAKSPCSHGGKSEDQQINFGIKCIVTIDPHDPLQQPVVSEVQRYKRSRIPRLRDLYYQYENQVTECKSWRLAHRQTTPQYQRFCAARRQPRRLTEETVREQFRRLPLPKGDLVFQPSWGALVNKKEIFYTRAEREHDYRLTLLGHHVVLHTHVDSYTWSWGDGSPDETFTVPGGPYPDFDVAHLYSKPAICAASVMLTYSATYRVDGGPVQPINGSVTVAGDPVDVRVLTAHAVLVQGNN